MKGLNKDVAKDISDSIIRVFTYIKNYFIVFRNNI